MQSSIHSEIGRLRVQDMHDAARRARLAPSAPTRRRARPRPFRAVGIRAIHRHA